MAVFKEMGWRVHCNPASGKLSIRRIGIPGEIIIPYHENHYTVTINDDDEQVVSTAIAQHKHLITRRVHNG